MTTNRLRVAMNNLGFEETLELESPNDNGELFRTDSDEFVLESERGSLRLALDEMFDFLTKHQYRATMALCLLLLAGCVQDRHYVEQVTTVKEVVTDGVYAPYGVAEQYSRGRVSDGAYRLDRAEAIYQFKGQGITVPMRDVTATVMSTVAYPQKVTFELSVACPRLDAAFEELAYSWPQQVQVDLGGYYRIEQVTFSGHDPTTNGTACEEGDLPVLRIGRSDWDAAIGDILLLRVDR